MNRLLWRFPAWFHGLVYLLAGRRLAWIGGGPRFRWFNRTDYWIAVVNGLIAEHGPR